MSIYIKTICITINYINFYYYQLIKIHNNPQLKNCMIQQDKNMILWNRRDVVICSLIQNLKPNSCFNYSLNSIKNQYYKPQKLVLITGDTI